MISIQTIRKLPNMNIKPCIKVLKRVIQNHESLSACLADGAHTPEQKAICYGVLRWYYQLEQILPQLLNTPLKAKNLPVALHLYIALYQILYGDMPDYAVVKETVNAIKQSKFKWATALTNKTLRQFIERREQIMQTVMQNPVSAYAHPSWMIERIKDSDVLMANNIQAPMTLRVNRQKITRNDYLNLLSQNNIEAFILESSNIAIQLNEPYSVDKLPGFFEGLCSVQDESGQLVAENLDLQPGQRVLDACSAPGSKTCHMLEAEPNLESITAIDVSNIRLNQLRDNIKRLQLDPDKFDLHATDACSLDLWWDKKPFDRILIDAPCSGSGVIRRHPDIKLLRRESDIVQLQQQQLKLIQTLAPLLAPRGKLIYSTCSIFDDENKYVIEKSGLIITESQQLYPKPQSHDGFFIAVLQQESY